MRNFRNPRWAEGEAEAMVACVLAADRIQDKDRRQAPLTDAERREIAELATFNGWTLERALEAVMRAR